MGRPELLSAQLVATNYGFLCVACGVPCSLTTKNASPITLQMNGNGSVILVIALMNWWIVWVKHKRNALKNKLNQTNVVFILDTSNLIRFS